MANLFLDMSQNNNHLVSEGTVTYADLTKNINALCYAYLDGAGSLILDNSFLRNSGAVSGGAWWNPDEEPTSVTPLMGIYSGANTDSSFMFYLSSTGRLNALVVNSTTATTVVGPTLSDYIAYGSWFYAGFTYKPSTSLSVYFFYENGMVVADQETSVPSSRNTGTLPFYIGRDSTGTPRYYTGGVCEPFVTRSSLSEELHFAVYAAGAHNFF
jgi:hypothetical protein